MTEQNRPPVCQNEGCGREPSPGERLCESCAIERSLFRRDERRQTAEPASPRPLPGVESLPR